MSGKGKKSKAKKKEEETTSNIKDIIDSFESVTADRDVDAELEAIAPPSSLKKSASSSSAKAAPASDASSLLEDLAPPSASAKVAPSNFVVDLTGISEEDLKERVLDSWQLPFDTSRYFANAWQFFSQNAREIVVAMFLWIGSLLIFEYLFYRIFGTHSLTYTHRVHSDGVHYVHASQLPNAPPGSQGALVQIDSQATVNNPTYQFLHVLSIFLHRVFIFYPIVASVYHAFFNALRRSTPLVTVSDFFAYFKFSRLIRLWPLASVLFMMTFAASLQLYLMPLWLYVHVITLFVIPLHVEHSHLSIGKYITTSIVLANGHIISCFMFLILIWAANLLGLIFLLVGFLVSFPFGHFAVGFAYHDMVGIKGVKRTDLDRMAIA